MTIITTGIKGPNIPLVARQEIRVLLQDIDAFNLYLQALARLQNTDQKDPLSWFQISGIHGRPYIPYDGSGTAGRFGGYCTHSSILFPPWHRPYLALFEQALGKHVLDIANSYPNAADKDKYTKAAARFRIPYWDWAANSDLPDVVSKQETVVVYTPQGNQTIKNPLFSYTFHPVYSDFGDGLPDEKTWESWQSTLRWPTTTDGSSKSQPDAMERGLINNRLTLRDRTYNLLTQATSYEAFSNDGFMGANTDPRFYDSLESVHGQIHGMTGRNGHMGVVDYAAFDPVFWLHHTNCDRLFAIWQALNPNSYVVPRRNDAGTFTTRSGTVENQDSPLTPFWQAPGVYWTSVGVRDTRTLNYTYPELTKWSDLSPQEKHDRLRTEVNVLYGKTAPIGAINPGLFQGVTSPSGSKPVPVPASKPSAPTARKAPIATAVAPNIAPVAAKVASVAGAAAGVAQAAPQKVISAVAAAPRAAAAVVGSTSTAAPIAQPAAAPSASKAPAAPKVAADNVDVTGVEQDKAGHWHDNDDKTDDKKHYHEWVANIRVEKYAVKSSFFVHIFLGDFTSDPKKWDEDPNLVGTHFVFANNLSFTGCERCQVANEEHKLVTGTIPLTGALGDRLGGVSGRKLEPEHIVPYLKQNLHWRIQKHDETPIERSEIPSLKVSVGHVLVELPDNIASFPTWGEMNRATAVTSGRAGGAGDDDD